MADQEEEEGTLIVVDNSWFMRSAASLGAYHNQIEAIELYCHAKLESNPKNAIGLYTATHSASHDSYLAPTSDIDKIMAYLHKGIRYSGDFYLSAAVPHSMLHIDQRREWSAFKHKRLLFFVGGHKSSKTALVSFVAAADNNGNSHIKHIQPGSSVPQIAETLSSYPPIIEIPRASMQQVEIAAAARKKLAKDKADRIKELHLLYLKGKNQAAPPEYLKGKNQAAPPPPPKAPQIYLRNKFDLLSLGTEKAMLAKGKKILMVR
ncbi:26S proteasome non-ATPase regulatory subunit 4 [Artemisia annua]|uniref:26S proteasome non-ATPase regulatory subunit 4 n=1 Tax=Artemisia annua TaxID=35608 RepID=A0A2U1L775_ARTAN|nr:26S proteasome non-ATPase regulatory subunit 4 [Artemisia annua]